MFAFGNFPMSIHECSALAFEGIPHALIYLIPSTFVFIIFSHPNGSLFISVGSLPHPNAYFSLVMRKAMRIECIKLECMLCNHKVQQARI